MAKLGKDLIQACDQQLENVYVYLGKWVHDALLDGSTQAQFQPGDPAEKEFNKLVVQLSDASATSQQEVIQKNRAGCRGLIEPYTKLSVDLFLVKRKFAALEENVGECVTLASSTFPQVKDSETVQLLTRFKEIGGNARLFIERKTETLKEVMSMKKKLIATLSGEKEIQLTEGEEKFLKDASSQIKHLSRSTEDLIADAKHLFRKIEKSYKKELNEQIREREQTLSAQPDQDPLLNESLAPVEVEEQPAAVEAYQEPEPSAEVLEDDAQEPALAQPEQADELGTFEQGLLETAMRKLTSTATSKRDQLRVLNTVIDSVPANATKAFLEALIKDANFARKMKTIDLLSEVDHPALGDLYSQLMTSTESMLKLHGMVGLCKLKPANLKDILLSAVNDPDEAIRRLVANHLGHVESQTEMAAMVKLSTDSSEGVARIAIRRLGRCQGRFAVSNLIPKLSHASAKIRQEAIFSLVKISGDDLGFQPNATEAQRRKAIKSWEKMLQESRLNPQFWEQQKSGEKPAPKKSRKRARTALK